jgi:isopenicillin N synthase-like dioxygenase
MHLRLDDEFRIRSYLIPRSYCRLGNCRLGLLARSDPVESQKLLLAAQTKGFFYIELSSPAGRAYLEEAEALLSWSTKFFQKPLEEKLLEICSDEIKSWTAGYVHCFKTICFTRLFPEDR